MMANLKPHNKGSAIAGWKKGKATRRTEVESSSNGGILLDDGMKSYDVYNQKGELLCQIRFRPGDRSIVRRCEEIKAELPMIFKPIVDANNDPTVDEETYNALVREAEAVLERQVTELFSVEGLSTLFEICSPLSIIKGRFFLEQILEVLAGLIDKENEVNHAQKWDHVRELSSHR